MKIERANTTSRIFHVVRSRMIFMSGWNNIAIAPAIIANEVFWDS